MGNDLWSMAGDHQRAAWRGPGIRRLIDFWEMIRDISDWFCVSDFAPPGTAQARWVRRNLYYLCEADLVEMDQIPSRGRRLEFRVKRKR